MTSPTASAAHPALPPAERFARRIAALPDAITAGFFLLLWIAPQWLGPAALRTGLLMMLVEFVLMHATGMLGGMALANAGDARRRWKPILLFGAFYLLFIAAWSWIFEAWWPLLALAWLVAGKLALAWQPLPDADKRDRLQSDWAISALAYLCGVFVTLMLPLPRLGLDAGIVAAARQRRVGGQAAYLGRLRPALFRRAGHCEVARLAAAGQARGDPQGLRLFNPRHRPSIHWHRGVPPCD